MRGRCFWDIIKDHINLVYNIGTEEDGVNKIITRRNIMNLRDASSPNTSTITVDHYRNLLTRAGYLRQVGRGRYMILNIIPASLAAADCRNVPIHYDYEEVSLEPSTISVIQQVDYPPPLGAPKESANEFLSEGEMII